MTVEKGANEQMPCFQCSGAPCEIQAGCSVCGGYGLLTTLEETASVSEGRLIEARGSDFQVSGVTPEKRVPDFRTTSSVERGDARGQSVSGCAGGHLSPAGAVPSPKFYAFGIRLPYWLWRLVYGPVRTRSWDDAA